MYTLLPKSHHHCTHTCTLYLRIVLSQEFVVQHNENANPPTFFLTLETLMEQMTSQRKVVSLIVVVKEASDCSAHYFIMYLHVLWLYHVTMVTMTAVTTVHT